MHSMKRILALCLSLLVLMMTTAMAEVPFLVHSNGWMLESAPVEVYLKADVDAHMPFDADRLAMLTPITDMLSLRLQTGDDEGRVAISLADKEALTLQYRGNQVQLSCMPGVTYTADAAPLNLLLGADVVSSGGYEALGLSSRGETLLTDGAELLAQIPGAFEANGKRAKTDTNISGYGQSSYRIDFTIAATKLDEMKETLLSICPEGWLHEIISGLTFSGKQTLRMYFTAADEVVRIEYNGSCGPEGNLRTVKLVGRFRDDGAVKKDYLELTSPAKKGKNKNNLTFERTIETNKKGARVVQGSYKYTVTDEGVTSIWTGDFNLNNAFTDSSDVITGGATFQTKLNGAEGYTAITLEPQLTISGTQDDPSVSGTLSITQTYAKKTTEKAIVTVDLKGAEPLSWSETSHLVDLSAMDEVTLAAAQQEVAAAIATSIVRPLIVQMGKDAEWFFRELPEDAVQSIVDAAADQ